MSTFLLTVGCGGKGATVSGKVTFKDKPLPGGQVKFLTEKGKVYAGNINEDGSYTVAKVPAGPVKISVLPKESPKIGGGGPQGMPFGGPPKDMVGPPKDVGIPADARKGFENLTKPDPNVVKNFPDKYKDAEKSELTYTVTDGDQTHDLPLK